MAVVVVIALRQIQDCCGSRAHADASPEFKVACVGASTEFKTAVVILACIDASVNSQDGDRAHALGGGASIYNSRWHAPSLKFNVPTFITYITYLVR